MTAVIVVLFTLLLCEVLVRVINPPPPVQVIRKDRFGHIDAGDVRVWIQESARMNLGCPGRYPSARNIVFAGDSIFFGSGIENGREFTSLLQKKLDRDAGQGKWCVVNLSQPAYSFEQKKYWLASFMSEHRVEQVFWEVWPNEAGRFRSWNGSLYNFAGTDGGNERLPSIAGGPNRLSGWLFSNSRFFEYLFLTGIRRQGFSPAWLENDYIPDLRALQAAVAGAGGRFALVFATRLDGPFGEVRVSDREPARDVVDHALASPGDFDGFDIMFLGRMFEAAGADYRAVRIDECCHFNEDGHGLMADMFFNLLTGGK